MLTTLTSVVVVVVLVVLVVAVVAVAVVGTVLRRRRAPQPAPPVAAPATRIPPPRDDRPMSGLEAALAQATDREGRSIGERIDAEADHVDELRIPDDTGPLLRRALDHVEQHDNDTAPTEAPGAD